MRCAAQHVESRALARRCRAEAGETGHGRQARHTAQIDHRCRHAAPAAPTAAAAPAAPTAAAATAAAAPQLGTARRDWAIVWLMVVLPEE